MIGIASLWLLAAYAFLHLAERAPLMDDEAMTVAMGIVWSRRPR